MPKRPTQPMPDPSPSELPVRRAMDGTQAQVDLGLLNDHLGYFVRRAQLWIFQDFIRTLAPLDIRPAQYSVLVAAGANPGSSQVDLADALAIERARLVRLLDKLEKRGLIERLPSASDRRSHAIHLTARGELLLERAKSLALEHEARLIRALGVEQRQKLIDGLKRIA